MNDKMRRLLLLAGVLCCYLGTNAAGGAMQAPRDSVVVDSITGDTRKYKLTNSKVLKPVYWLYNYLANSNKLRSDVNYDGGFVAGPAYNINTGFAIGGGYSALYSMDKTDPNLKKSIINGYFQVSVEGVVAVGVEGHNYLKQDNRRFNYDVTLTHYPSAFWGIGYKTSLDNYYNNVVVGSKQILVKLEADYTWRLAQNLYMGPKIEFLTSALYKTSDDDLMDRLLAERYGETQSHTLVTTGVGFTLTYDSRDFAMNAYKGHYFNLQQLGFIPGINKYGFFSTDVKYQVYTPLWKKCTLAVQAHGRFNYGNSIIPWTRLSSTGNQGMGRGYFFGQFRDNNVMEVQLELRQRLFWRLGIVGWVGAINIFESFNKMYMSHTLPSYGFGLRWEFKPRVNVRVDWGFTKTGNSIVFNMAEAF